MCRVSSSLVKIFYTWIITLMKNNNIGTLQTQLIIKKESYLTNQKNIRATKPRLSWYTIAKLNYIQSGLYFSGRNWSVWRGWTFPQTSARQFIRLFVKCTWSKEKIQCDWEEIQSDAWVSAKGLLHAMYLISTRTFSLTLLHSTATMSHWQTYDEMRFSSINRASSIH